MGRAAFFPETLSYIIQTFLLFSPILYPSPLGYLNRSPSLPFTFPFPSPTWLSSGSCPLWTLPDVLVSVYAFPFIYIKLSSPPVLGAVMQPFPFPFISFLFFIQPDSLDLKLQVVVSHVLWMLATDFWLCGRIASSLKP